MVCVELREARGVPLPPLCLRRIVLVSVRTSASSPFAVVSMSAQPVGRRRPSPCPCFVRRVLELGSGMGVSGLIAHKTGASLVVLTDGDETAMSRLREVRTRCALIGVTNVYPSSRVVLARRANRPHRCVIGCRVDVPTKRSVIVFIGGSFSQHCT